MAQDAKQVKILIEALLTLSILKGHIDVALNTDVRAHCNMTSSKLSVSDLP